MGQQAPLVGQQAPLVGQQAPLMGQQAPLMGQQASHMGQQVPCKKIKLDPAIKSETFGNGENKIPEALEERLSVMEAQVKPTGPVPKGVYERLKALENRILFLEGVSPEYEGFLNSKCKCQIRTKDSVTVKLDHGSSQDQITESLSAINNRINQLKTVLKLKAIKEEPV